jgi:hypothetical protein
MMHAGARFSIALHSPMMSGYLYNNLKVFLYTSTIEMFASPRVCKLCRFSDVHFTESAVRQDEAHV